MVAIRACHWRRGAQILLVFSSAILPVACARAPQATRPITTYYLSPSGNDAATGTSPATAWRSLGHASRVILRPGTRLLLQGGTQFTGQLTLGQRDAGDAARPVVIGSYGNGAATIKSIGTAIYVYDTAGIDITDLNLVGQPPAGISGAGLNLYNDLPAGRRLDHVIINHVSVRGFANGVAFGGENNGAGFDDVEVSNCLLNGNVDAGLISYGPRFNPGSPTYANQDVDVSHVVASQNSGNSAARSRSTGNGIVLGSVRGGIVAWSTADNNGGATASSRGPAGIWTYDSTDVTIERNISFDNRTRDQVDGNGFGLDQNTSDSVMQDNLSYGNDGAGFLVYSGLNDGAQDDNIIRFNISSGDSQDGSQYYGGISVIGEVANTEVYQNTVIGASGPGEPGMLPPALRLGVDIRSATIRNNIFATNYSPFVAASRALPLSIAEFQGNDYYSAMGAWSIVWGETIYDSLPAWRSASSEEIVANRLTGFTANPQTVGPVLGLRAKLADQPGIGDGFVLRRSSPLIGAGLDLASLFGLNPGSLDYSGNPESVQHPNVGAQ